MLEAPGAVPRGKEWTNISRGKREGFFGCGARRVYVDVVDRPGRGRMVLIGESRQGGLIEGVDPFGGESFDGLGVLSLLDKLQDSFLDKLCLASLRVGFGLGRRFAEVLSLLKKNVPVASSRFGQKVLEPGERGGGKILASSPSRGGTETEFGKGKQPEPSTHIICVGLNVFESGCEDLCPQNTQPFWDVSDGRDFGTHNPLPIKVRWESNRGTELRSLICGWWGWRGSSLLSVPVSPSPCSGRSETRGRGGGGGGGRQDRARRGAGAG